MTALFTSCYSGRRLVIDLSSKEFRIEKIEENEYKLFIGGRGLNAYYAYRHKLHLCAPFSDKNMLLFSPGALVGMPCLYANRMTVTSKSPLTDFLGDSNVGGNFPVFLKWAEWDQVVIEKKSDKPLYLVIDKNKCTFEDASYLWGIDSDEAETALLQKYKNKKNIACMVIGQGGENKVRFASIHSGAHAAGRTGMGAIMGDKKIKAVLILGSIPRYEGFDASKKIIKKLANIVNNDPAVEKAKIYGATTAIEGFNSLGVLEVKNLSTGVWSEVDKISGKRLRDKHTIRRYGCIYCNIHCKGISRFNNEYGDYEVHGPEFAGLQNYGARILNSDLPSVCFMTKLSNKKGIDFMSMGGILSWLMECLEKGYISHKDIDDIQLGWGKVKESMELINLVAERKGVGQILAEGAARASDFFGKETKKCLLTVKKMEFEGCDPRGYKGRGVGFGVSSRGADNCRTLSAFEGLLKKDEAKLLYGSEDAAVLTGVKGKGKLLKYIEDYSNVADLLGLCRYGMYVFASSKESIVARGDAIGEYFSNISNIESYRDYDALVKASERTLTLERVMLQENGCRRKDDLLPKRFRKEPMPEGPAKGGIIENEAILSEYYEARGWTKDGLVRKKDINKLYKLMEEEE